MAAENGANVNAGVVNLAGEGISVIADCDPEKFPHGIDVQLFPPGGLAPIFGVRLPAGQMLAILPAGMSAGLRSEIRRAIAEHQAAEKRRRELHG